eukprot:gene3349-5896_t
MNKLKTLILIDGQPIIYRGYFSNLNNLKDMKNLSNVPVNAVYNYTRILFSIIKQFKGDHYGLFFDSKTNFRHEIYSSYKTNRKKTETNLLNQFPLVHEMTELLGLSKIQKDYFEADDLIANYSKVLSLNQENHVIIVSSDKDLYQLLDENVTIYDPMKRIFINEMDIKTKFGITSKQFLDFQCLVGDKADNIPGCAGIGIKNAARLLNEHETLENVIKFSKGTLRQKIEASMDNIRLSRKLLEFRYDDSIEITSLEMKNFENEKLNNFLEQMNFPSIKNNLKDCNNLKDFYSK